MPRSLRLIAQIVAGLGVGLIVTVAALHLVGGWRILAIASDSMTPAFSRGDLVLVRPVATTDVNDGDLILFTTGEETRVDVVHRVHSIVTINLSVKQADGTMSTTTGRQFVTKGDANLSPDPWQVDARNLQGRVYAILPGLGWPLLNYPVTFLLAVLAGVVGLAWAVYELGRFRRRHTSQTGAGDLVAPRDLVAPEA